MKLFLIKRFKHDYDEYDAKVVRAENEWDARQLCAKVRGDEDADEWLNSSKSQCTEVLLDGDSCVILDSFNAG